MKVLTAVQMREVDRLTIELGIPGIVLMENAGRNTADLITRWSRRLPSPIRAAVICGKGNNGGDGFVIARHLSRSGFDVQVDLVAEASSQTGDAAVNFHIIKQMGIPIHALLTAEDLEWASQRWRECPILVDALLGTGFEGQVREPYRSAIEKINAIHAPMVVAVDVPSGLDVDTGKPGGIAIQATNTVTFIAKKIGYAAKTAKPYLGRVFVADIGIPLEMILPHVT